MGKRYHDEFFFSRSGMCWTRRKTLEKIFWLSLEEYGSPRRGNFNLVESAWKSREVPSRACWLQFWQNFSSPWCKKGRTALPKRRKSTFTNRSEIHASGQVDHADHDSGNIFLFRKVKRRTALPESWNLTFTNWAENHVSGQVDHADHDSGNTFLFRGVKKEKCSPGKLKFNFHNWAENHVGAQVDHADHDSGNIFLLIKFFLDFFGVKNNCAFILQYWLEFVSLMRHAA